MGGARTAYNSAGLDFNQDPVQGLADALSSPDRLDDVLLDRLPDAGFDKLAPADGAFYIYADVRRLTNDSLDFCRRMLAETGVAAAPGVDFDPARGHAFVRFSFAGATADMAAAMDRLTEWRR